MSNEKALETVAMFQEKLRSLLEMGPNSNWRVEWDICQNDIEEWIKGTFEEGSKDYQEIHRILHPTVLVLGRDDYQGFVYDAQRLQRSFALTEHRLKEGQAQPLQDTADELLIEPGTPHSAYVFLRDIVEAASRLVFLVDPYVDRTLFSLLSNVAARVEIRILTRPQNVPRLANSFNRAEYSWNAERALPTFMTGSSLLMIGCSSAVHRSRTWARRARSWGRFRTSRIRS